jgi:hypothetical protein
MQGFCAQYEMRRVHKTGGNSVQIALRVFRIQAECVVVVKCVVRCRESGSETGCGLRNPRGGRGVTKAWNSLCVWGH